MNINWNFLWTPSIPVYMYMSISLLCSSRTTVCAIQRGSGVLWNYSNLTFPSVTRSQSTFTSLGRHYWIKFIRINNYLFIDHWYVEWLQHGTVWCRVTQTSEDFSINSFPIIWPPDNLKSNFQLKFVCKK